jgi:hypothetical protein
MPPLDLATRGGDKLSACDFRFRLFHCQFSQFHGAPVNSAAIIASIRRVMLQHSILPL